MGYRSVLYRKQLELRGTAGSRGEPLPLEEAVAKLKAMVGLKSDRRYKGARARKAVDQTVELVMHLGIDARQADQMIRGAISLPKGIGKSRRVVAFCDEATAEAARQAGACEAGADELIERVQGGWLDFDVAIAHPALMGKVGKLGRILGPQGKMPAPKAGTVTPDVVTAVREFSAGRLEFRNDDGGNVHFPVGKASFSAEDLKQNIEAAITHVTRMKPAAAKGQFVKKVCLAATHTPPVHVTVG
ncbi:MAG TPA: 50S ribosomal protein L1 [Phycisphaerae bacterium]|nr:50S ribosomal protein L1 [Phycisphaerae bacterium]HNU44443.1 50S ribosomal protein L1 [Phycisphaerae bacterium]